MVFTHQRPWKNTHMNPESSSSSIHSVQATGGAEYGDVYAI